MEIKINVFSKINFFKITANTNSGQFVCNGKNVNINVNDFAQKLLSIVAFWDENLTLPNVQDAESYLITIIKDGQKLNLTGQGKYPQGYSEFINLLKEVSAC